MGASVLVLVVWAAAGAGAGEPPTPAPTPAPTPSPAASAGPPRPRLRLNLDKLVEKRMEEEAKGAPPRFEETIEVEGETPQGVLERQLRGVPLDCGPAGGPPTEADSRAVRPHVSPYADFIPLAKKLGGLLKKKPKEKYFLYRLRRPEGATYAVRTERVPDAWLVVAPGGTAYEFIEAFGSMGDATRALRRLEQGFARTARSAKDAPPQPWTTQQPCTPK